MIHPRKPLCISIRELHFPPHHLLVFSLLWSSYWGTRHAHVCCTRKHDPAPRTLPIDPLHVISGPCIYPVSHPDNRFSSRLREPSWGGGGGAYSEQLESHGFIPRNRDQALTVHWVGVRIGISPKSARVGLNVTRCINVSAPALRGLIGPRG